MSSRFANTIVEPGGSVGRAVFAHRSSIRRRALPDAHAAASASDLDASMER